MKVLITGSSGGIGRAIAARFLTAGHEVVGLDRSPAALTDARYTHYQLDIRDDDRLPEIPGVQVLINCAGTQNEEDRFLYRIEVFDNGRSTIDVLSQNRETISFSGEMTFD